MTFELEEEERQMIVLALALTARLRPGFDPYLGGIAEKFQSRGMYDSFKRFNENVKPQVIG